MRVVAFVACLAILGAVLCPEASLAQPSATSEYRSVPQARGHHARTPAVAAITPVPTPAVNLEPTPIPPTFYSVSQLGDHLHAVRWELAIVGAAILTVGIKDWDWGNTSGFQTIEEGWFAKNTRHGGMDKIGHSFSTYVIADLADGQDPGQCRGSHRRPDHGRARCVRHHGVGGDPGRLHRPAPLLA